MCKVLHTMKRFHVCELVFLMHTCARVLDSEKEAGKLANTRQKDLECCKEKAAEVYFHSSLLSNEVCRGLWFLSLSVCLLDQ